MGGSTAVITIQLIICVFISVCVCVCVGGGGVGMGGGGFNVTCLYYVKAETQPIFDAIPSIEAGRHWWEASIITAPSLPPQYS